MELNLTVSVWQVTQKDMFMMAVYMQYRLLKHNRMCIIIFSHLVFRVLDGIRYPQQINFSSTYSHY